MGVSEDCIHCGCKVSAGQGQYTPDRGFLCNTCHESLHIVHCSSCGQRYPSYEMTDVDGRLFCKQDAEYKSKEVQREPVKPTAEAEEDTVVYFEPKRRPAEIKPFHRYYDEMKDLYEHSEAPEPIRAREDRLIVEETVTTRVTRYSISKKGLIARLFSGFEQWVADF